MTVITRSFKTRAEMMRYTRAYLQDHWAKVASRAVAAHPSPYGKLRALLLVQCPTNDETLADASLWLETLAPHQRDDTLVTASRKSDAKLLGMVGPLLQELGVNQDVAPFLMLVVYGLNVAAIEDPATWTFQRVERAIDELLLQFAIVDDSRQRIAALSPPQATALGSEESTQEKV
jgi:hypothetical protein